MGYTPEQKILKTVNMKRTYIILKSIFRVIKPKSKVHVFIISKTGWNCFAQAD